MVAENWRHNQGLGLSEQRRTLKDMFALSLGALAPGRMPARSRLPLLSRGSWKLARWHEGRRPWPGEEVWRKESEDTGATERGYCKSSVLMQESRRQRY